MMDFTIGKRVIKNPETWIPSEFDQWGRGVGVGTIIDGPFPDAPEWVDVCWSSGRCYERIAGLLLEERKKDDQKSCNGIE